MPDEAGKYYFDPANAPLAKMFQTLGIKNLRIGGNTVDSAKVSIPVQADIDALFEFAKAADTKVIYSFRLNKGDPATSAEQAKYIADHYAANLACFSIGNECDMYVHSYAGYLKEWQPIYDAINRVVPNAKQAEPDLQCPALGARFRAGHGTIRKNRLHHAARICRRRGRQDQGPGSWPRPDALARMAADLSKILRQNSYPMAAGVPYRLEEANNFYNGGAQDISDTFASALWGLDYLYWYAAHGAQGINFHNGDEVAAGQQLTPCRYASFTSVPDGYMAHPLAYGIKIFNLGSRGQMVSSTLVPDDSGKDINLLSYAVLGADKNLYVTLINKEHGATARDADVTIKSGAVAYAHGQTISLLAPGGDVAAKDGLTLGGNPINHDGSWQEKWTDLPAPPADGSR